MKRLEVLNKLKSIKSIPNFNQVIIISEDCITNQAVFSISYFDKGVDTIMFIAERSKSLRKYPVNFLIYRNGKCVINGLPEGYKWEDD